MKDIEGYLAGEFKSSKETVETIDRSLKGITNLFTKSFGERKGNAGWPYEWGESNTDNYLRVLDGKPSISTQAMCIAAVDQLLNYWRGDSLPLSTEIITSLESHRTKSLEGILKQVESGGWVSPTFGENDAFTASWVINFRV